MAEYLVLIYGDEKAYVEGGQPLQEATMAGHLAFGSKHGPAIRGGNALQPVATATSVRQGTVTDGPFVETKEALAGYYLIEAPDLDAAIAIASDVPHPTGGLEVRPVLVFD